MLALEESIARIVKALDCAEGAWDQVLPIHTLAERAAWCPRSFERHFRHLVGLSPQSYLRQRRLGFAADLLLESRYSVARIAYEVGFESPEAFAKAFRRQFRASPLAFRSEGFDGWERKIDRICEQGLWSLHKSGFQMLPQEIQLEGMGISGVEFICRHDELLKQIQSWQKTHPWIHQVWVWGQTSSKLLAERQSHFILGYLRHQIYDCSIESEHIRIWPLPSGSWWRFHQWDKDEIFVWTSQYIWQRWLPMQNLGSDNLPSLICLHLGAHLGQILSQELWIPACFEP